jgi:hypothetical protein
MDSSNMSIRYVRHALSHGADISLLKHITPEQKQTALDYEIVL